MPASGFYRDHCLHGMVVESPGQSQVDACVNTIKEAVEAMECDTVLYPERTDECSFLSPPRSLTTTTTRAAPSGRRRNR